MAQQNNMAHQNSFAAQNNMVYQNFMSQLSLSGFNSNPPAQLLPLAQYNGGHTHHFGRVYEPRPIAKLRCITCGVTLDSPVPQSSSSHPQQPNEPGPAGEGNRLEVEKFKSTSYCKFRRSQRPKIPDYGPIVKIIAGDGKGEKEFLVHKGLISWASSYFYAAFKSGRFKEGIEGVVRLEDDKPVLVELLLDWLYNRRIPGYNTNSTDDLKKMVNSLQLYDLYIFADCRGVRALKNDIIDCIADSIARTWAVGFRTTVVSHIYANVPRGDPMTKLMVAYVVKCTEGLKGEKYNEDSILDNYPVEFILDYALALESRQFTTKSRRMDWCQMDRCAFHEHPEGKESTAP